MVLNFTGWLILMLLFAILRRAAGNYGRWALVRRDGDPDTKWTQLFYAPDDVTVEGETIQNGSTQQRVVIEESIDYAGEEADVEDRRIGGWIRSIFTLSDDRYLQKCGVDAVQYLKFQRHLIFFTAVITLVCIIPDTSRVESAASLRSDAVRHSPPFRVSHRRLAKVSTSKFW